MRGWPAPARWLMAELIPFACLFVGMVLTRAGVPPVGFILGLFVGVPLTVWYLNWVLDTHASWVFPLLLFTIPAVYVGELMFSKSATSNGEPVVVTATYWEVLAGLAVGIAVTVALAVANGERHRGRYLKVLTPR